MDLRSLIRVNPSPGAQPFSANASDSGIGVFVTTQSILTFPVASTAVTTINKVLGIVFPNFVDNEGSLLIISLIIGIIIYYISINETMNIKDKIISFFLAIINSFFLAASALGLQNTFNL